MSLTDLMSHSGTVLFAEIALVVFFLVFLALVWHLFRPGRRQQYEADARLPLDDSAPAPLTPDSGARR